MSAAPLAALQSLVHGTTAATNAVLTRKLARTGLITTRGFRDVLELGRRTRPQAYGMTGTFRVMDHGRFGPQGALGGHDGAPNRVAVRRGGETHVPKHLSKEQDIPLRAGDRVAVDTPGGGFGSPEERDPALVAEDVRLRYYTPAQAQELWGVALLPDGTVDSGATARLRAKGGA